MPHKLLAVFPLNGAGRAQSAQGEFALQNTATVY